MFPFSFISGGSASFTSEYQAILDEATTQGYTLPSAGQQVLQNQLIIDLNTANIWDKLDVFYVYANDAGEDFATLNWKNPLLNQNTLINSPAFTSNEGFQGNGVSASINTNFNPQTSGVNYSLNSASVGFWTELLQNSDNFVYNSDTSQYRVLSAINFRQLTNDSDFSLRTSPAGNVKLYHSDRNTSTNKNMFENGVGLGPYTATSSIESTNFTLLTNGIAFSTTKLSVFFAGASLSTEAASFYTALNNYMTSL
jgi:hypothetical protein